MIMNKYYNIGILLLNIFLISTLPVTAQRINDEMESHDHWGQFNDSVQTTDVPVGLKVWTIDKRFARVTPAVPDTVHHLFQNDNLTDGLSGEYNYLGNLGSPRINRLAIERNFSQTDAPFLFATPYDFFLLDTDELQFTNTKSPIANITYHTCGNKQNGEDRIRARFATNAGKKFGMGFVLDYSLGRGYYTTQTTSQFDGTIFASYRGDRYNLHTHYTGEHLKTAENGGIEDDSYVTQPELFTQKYGTADIPTVLSKAWNKLYINTLYLSHHYNLGKLKRQRKGEMADSVVVDMDSISVSSEGAVVAQEKGNFIPVARFIHTLQFDYNKRQFLSNAHHNANSTDYFADFYLPGDSASDRTHYIDVANTLGFELCEGFNPWMKAGLTFFAKHHFQKYKFINLHHPTQSYVENYLNLGAEISKRQGDLFHFNALGEYRLSGKKWSEFNAEGNVAVHIPTKRDTIHLLASARVQNEIPNFYLRHYHARNAWWDNTELKNQFSAHANFKFQYKGTSVGATYHTLQNYTYLAERAVKTSNSNPATTLHGASVIQADKNISLLGVQLKQHLRFGIFNWDIEGTAQYSTDAEALPVPIFSGYTNMYLKFKIAKVLSTEFGADMRYFTAYYAPTYSPIMGQYAVQSQDNLQKVGNYPLVNVYANFHLKKARFYVICSHVNHKLGVGRPFYVPHYPLNRMIFRFGISWNFNN